MGRQSCQTYGYDGFNRLTVAQEAGSWSRSNSYDVFGNRTVNVEAAQTISPATNRITAVAGYANDPGYDNAGNLTFHPQIGTMGYDAENRQTVFTGSGKTGTYVYDGEGNRIKTISTGIGGGTALYVYDALGRLAAEYSPNGSMSSTRTEYRTTDRLNSTRVVTDQAQGVVTRRDYYPFGQRIEDTWGERQDIDAYAEDPALKHRFTAKERDDESGLDYFGARYFGSSLGRFTSPDIPFADQSELRPQSWNLYAYARNNPPSFVDPSGRCSQAADGGYTDEGEGLFPGPCADGTIGGSGPGDSTTVSGKPGNALGAFALNAAFALDATASSYFGFLTSAIGVTPSYMQPIPTNKEFTGQAATGVVFVASVMIGPSGGGAGRAIRILEQTPGVIHLEVKTAHGAYEVMANIRREGTKLILDNAHIEGTGAGQFGAGVRREMREAARQFGREQGASEVIINPGVRTSGANPGHSMPSFRVEVE